MGDHICSKFEEIGRLMKAVGSPQVKVCLDTQHLFAAGYNIVEKDGLERTMEEFDREIGLDNLVAVHANDSKIPFAGGVDRHENIGEGHMGVEGFRVIMGHPAFRDVPFLLEGARSGRQGPGQRQRGRSEGHQGRAGDRGVARRPPLRSLSSWKRGAGVYWALSQVSWIPARSGMAGSHRPSSR